MVETEKTRFLLIDQKLEQNNTLILQTKGGGLPYLNDDYTEYLNISLKNILFGELINYLNIFEEFSKKKAIDRNFKLLNSYFNLDHIYLGFSEYKDDYGISDNNAYLMHSSTGKSKITTSEYIKYINMFNPEYAVIPFEYLSSDAGKKRAIRCYKKMNDFFKEYVTIQNNDIKNTKIILPFFTYHFQYLQIEDFNNNANNCNGVLIFTDNNLKNVNFDIIRKYKKIINENIKVDMKIKNNNNTIFDIFIGKLIGCNYLEISFPFEYGLNGKCLVINFDDYHKEKDYGNFKAITNLNYNVNLIDLTDIKYEKDLDILSKNCQCFACRSNYKRAYIHHLFKCHELNGNILLNIHNVYNAKKLYEIYNKFQEENQLFNYLMWFIRENCSEMKN